MYGHKVKIESLPTAAVAACDPQRLLLYQSRRWPRRRGGRSPPRGVERARPCCRPSSTTAPTARARKGKQTERSDAQSVTRCLASPPVLYLATSLQFANFEVRELELCQNNGRRGGGESLRESIQHSSALISFLCLRFSSASMC